MPGIKRRLTQPMDKKIPQRNSCILNIRTLTLVLISFFSLHKPLHAQSFDTITADPALSYQTITGFGGSLAYYEGWVTAHPSKSLIYQALFGELGLDILRVRNAHDYDPGMIDRVAEFVQAAETVRGKPISLLSTSWGPPAYLKSNNSRSNGGTLKYTVTGGKVEFDYAGFAHWWNASLDAYNDRGIFPDYISIQNEPDWTASYESCRLNPTATVNFNDTIAGYDKALAVVYDTVHTRTVVPAIIGPETIGIGYNAVENYGNMMDLSRITVIAHHLYHGVDENNPYASTNFKKVGDYHPEIPHFQSEYSRGDWWSVAGMLYMSLAVENVTAYLYWDLAWDGGGLISLQFPWDRSRWTNPYGFTRTKEFYAFKHYSAFIHPGWKRIDASASGQNAAVSAFISPGEDSATMVVINRSTDGDLIFKPLISGYSIDSAKVYLTSSTANCQFMGDKKDALVSLPPKSIATVSMRVSPASGPGILIDSLALHPENTEITTRLDSIRILAEIFPAPATDRALFWQIVENTEVAGITQDGILYAKGTADGEVTVRAMATDGSGTYADTLIAVINQVLAGSITLTASSTLIDIPGDSIQISFVILPENAFNQAVHWEIVNGGDIATIDQSGWLRAGGNGDGDVTVRASATDGSGVYKEITIKLTNQVAVTGILITATDTVIDELMGSVQLEATVMPENASSPLVTWSVTGGEVLATVDANGLLTATGSDNGTTTVRAAAEADPDIYDEMVIRIINQENSVPPDHQVSLNIWYANGKLHYRLPAAGYTRTIMIFTVEGRLLETKEIPAFTDHGQMEPGRVPKGSYLIVVVSPGSERSRISVQ